MDGDSTAYILHWKVLDGFEQNFANLLIREFWSAWSRTVDRCPLLTLLWRWMCRNLGLFFVQYWSCSYSQSRWYFAIVLVQAPINSVYFMVCENKSSVLISLPERMYAVKWPFHSAGKMHFSVFIFFSDLLFKRDKLLIPYQSTSYTSPTHKISRFWMERFADSRENNFGRKPGRPCPLKAGRPYLKRPFRVNWQFLYFCIFL